VKVFLTYSHKDERWAQRLVSELSDRGIDVWDAVSKLAPGDNWPLEIGKALERAQAMIVVLSPSAARSSRLRREIEYALGSRKFQNRLIPVILEPTEKIPWILRHLEAVKGKDPSQVSDRVVKRLRAASALN
jgi:hypothetical protein